MTSGDDAGKQEKSASEQISYEGDEINEAALKELIRAAVALNLGK